MYIEGISLENFIATKNKETVGTPQARTLHVVFHSFLSDYRKQYSDTTIAHNKHIIELLKQHNIVSNTLNTIWKKQIWL